MPIKDGLGPSLRWGNGSVNLKVVVIPAQAGSAIRGL